MNRSQNKQYDDDDADRAVWSSLIAGSVGQQEARYVEIESKRARIIEQAMNRLKSDERPAITSSLLVSPAGTDADGSFEWPVADRWIAEANSSHGVTVEVIIEADGDTGKEQYESVRSSVTECADLMNLPRGVDATHFLIEQLFAGMEHLFRLVRQLFSRLEPH